MFKHVIIAAALFASASSAFAAKGQNFQCGGTEPFWDLWINEKGMALSEGVDFKITRLQNVTAVSAVNTTTDHLRIYRTVSSVQKTPLTIIIRADRYEERDATGKVVKAVGHCSDGMSDNEYDYSVTVLYGTGSEQKVLDGCCYKY